MADLIELKVPDIGDFDSVEIIEVLVAEGDSINADQEVITIESDKAMMKVKVGDKVSEGSVIALIESSDAGTEENEKPAEKAAESKPAEKEKPAAAESKPAPTPTVANPEPERTETLPYAPDTGSAKKPSHASPSVRQFARELGVPLAAVVGSGQKGRITKEDVQNFVKQVMNAPAPKAAEGAGIPSVPVINFEQNYHESRKFPANICMLAG
jgi:pyruvate dehydrogenase E2 component (dihydrolipoamide acetyltransferase)